MGTEDFLQSIRRVQAGDRRAEEALLRENMPLVAAIARRYQNCGLNQEDMMQLGSIGLLQALRRFDPDRGLCFSTYAVPLIAGEIRRFLRDDGMVKFSREAKSLALKIERVRREQGDLTVAELSKQLNVPAEDITAALASRAGALSLDAPTDEDGTDLNSFLGSSDASRIGPKTRWESGWGSPRCRSPASKKKPCCGCGSRARRHRSPFFDHFDTASGDG